MSKPFELLKEERIAPPDAEAQTFLLSPLDVYCFSCRFYLSWPLFFDYDLDADRLNEALVKLSLKYPILCGRVRPEADTCYCIQVDPGESTAFGFPFTELKADMTVASALLKYGQVTAPNADFPIYPDLPFFMEALDVETLLRGEAPPARARLTHFSDGCAVSIVISHTLMDGQRLIELYRDLGRAYRGEEIPDRCHDRSFLWPDQLAKRCPFLGEVTAQLPRKLPVKPALPTYTTFPGDSSCLEALYFSKGTLQAMKDIVKPFLAADKFVSSNDVLVAFVWMLSSEIFEERAQPVTDGAHLGIAGTMTVFTLEYLKNGADFFPENFCGNGYGFHMHTSEGLDLDEKQLAHIFAELSLLVRESVSAFRTQPPVAAQTALAYYAVASTGQLPMDVTTFRGSLTSMVKTPVAEVDFGQGAPKMAHIVGPLPLVGPAGSAAPGPGNGGGVVIHLQMAESQRRRIKGSSTVRECAPGMKQLFSDFTVDDLQTLLKS